MSKILDKIKYYVGGREYGKMMDGRVSPEAKQRIQKFNDMSLKRKITTTGGYMIQKIKRITKGSQ